MSGVPMGYGTASLAAARRLYRNTEAAVTTYLIAQLDIHDREEYSKYEEGFRDSFSQYGGKLLSVEEDPETLEGNWSFTRTVLIEFPSKEVAMGWYDSDDYQALVQRRFAASTGNLVMIEGLPGAGS